MPQTTNMPNDTTTTKPRKRRNLRKVHPPARSPKVEIVPSGVKVELSGRHGQKGTMLLDRHVWSYVRQFREWWLFKTSANSNHVGSGTLAAARLAAEAGLPPQAPGTRPNVALARIIARPGSGQDVVYLNGNPLDLRRENLEVMEKAEREERAGIMRRCLRVARAVLAEAA